MKFFNFSTLYKGDNMPEHIDDFLYDLECTLENDTCCSLYDDSVRLSSDNEDDIGKVLDKYGRGKFYDTIKGEIIDDEQYYFTSILIPKP